MAGFTGEAQETLPDEVPLDFRRQSGHPHARWVQELGCGGALCHSGRPQNVEGEVGEVGLKLSKGQLGVARRKRAF